MCFISRKKYNRLKEQLSLAEDKSEKCLAGLQSVEATVKELEFLNGKYSEEIERLTVENKELKARKATLSNISPAKKLSSAKKPTAKKSIKASK